MPASPGDLEAATPPAAPCPVAGHAQFHTDLPAQGAQFRIDVGHLGFMRLALLDQKLQRIGGDERQLLLHIAFLSFGDVVDVAHCVVVDALETGNQAADYGVDFNFQLLRFGGAYFDPRWFLMDER